MKEIRRERYERRDERRRGKEKEEQKDDVRGRGSQSSGLEGKL